MRCDTIREMKCSFCKADEYDGSLNLPINNIGKYSKPS